MNETSAIYEPMLPMGWFGDQPTDHALSFEPGIPIPPGWCEVTVRRRLSCGIEIGVERRGFAVYDFADWLPGVARPPGTPAIRTLAAASEAAKPALIQRLRIMNAHLTLLHAAAMHQHNESPPVMRVHANDLYRFDYPDESNEGYWYQRLGDTLPTHVTAVDRTRIGTMQTATFELSIDWLDDVIAAGMLIEFDLLNQIQAALATDDYALAVVAGWTICELRIRAAGLAISRGNANKVSVIVDTLVQHGLISKAVGDRLHELRRRRNSWLHSGVEPTEQVALESLRLATTLLQGTVPNLTTRATRRLLIL